MAHIVKRTTSRGINRWDVRTRIDGRTVTRTFARRKDADAYASTVEADKYRGVAIDPRRSRVTLEQYARQWLAHRTDLADRTIELYEWLLKRHIEPKFGSVALGDISSAAIRSWHAGIAQAHPTTAAKSYRLLSTILRTAVSDMVIVRNPCQIKGASLEHAPERPLATAAEVTALTAAMPDHLQIAVLLATWCQLRRGEVRGLRRRDIDLLHGTLTVTVTRTMSMAGSTVVKGPKSKAGRRKLTIPFNAIEPLIHHLDTYVDAAPDAWILPGTDRALSYAWNKARTKIGRTELRLHDLRHTGLTFSGAAGASVAELMHRGGQSSPAAALRYQHATEDRDHALANELAKLSNENSVANGDARDGRAIENQSAGDGEQRPEENPGLSGVA